MATFTTPTGAQVGIPGSTGSSLQPETVLKKSTQSQEKLIKAQIAEADKFVKEKEAEVKMRYHKNTWNGIDDPSELIRFYEKQSQYYESTGRGEKAALSEQRGFLALEKYQRQLEKGGSGGDGEGSFGTKEGSPDDFSTAWDVLNTHLENLGRARDNGAINPREYGSMMEELLKEKQKLVEDFVVDVDDRNKLLNGENFFGTNPIEYEVNKSGKTTLKIAEENPLGLDEKQSFQKDWEWWKESRLAKEEMVWRQEFDENGIAHWTPTTKGTIQDSEDVYLTHERYSRFMQEGEDGNMTAVENVSEAGQFYFQPKIARNERGEATGLAVYDQQSGDTDVLAFTDKAGSLLDALNRGEIDDKKALSLLSAPQSEAGIEYFDEGVTLGSLLEDDQLTQSWSNGGRWLGEPDDSYNTRIEKMRADIASGNLQNISITDDGKIKMSADLPTQDTEQVAEMGGLGGKLKENVLKSKYFSNEAAREATRKQAEQQIANNPDLFGTGPGQINPEQYVQDQMSGSRALFGFLRPVVEAAQKPSESTILQLLQGPAAVPLQAAAQVAGKKIAPALSPAVKRVQEILSNVNPTQVGAQAVAGMVTPFARAASQIQPPPSGTFTQGAQAAERRAIQEKGKVSAGTRLGGGISAAVKAAFGATSRQAFQNILNAFKR